MNTTGEGETSTSISHSELVGLIWFAWDVMVVGSSLVHAEADPTHLPIGVSIQNLVKVVFLSTISTCIC